MSARTKWIGLAVAVAAVAFFAVWYGGRSAGAVEVEVAEPVRRPVFRSTVTASGEIVATRYADIGSDVMGRIVSLPVREGDRVRGVRRVIGFVLAVLLADGGRGRQPVAETLTQRGEQRRIERHAGRGGCVHHLPFKDNACGRGLRRKARPCNASCRHISRVVI